MPIPNLTYWQSLTEQDCHEFKAITKNETTNKDITSEISEITFSYDEKSSCIRSIKASFSIENTNLISNGDTISITLYNKDNSFSMKLLTGKAKLQKKSYYSYMKHDIDIEVISEIGNLYEKTVPKDTFFFKNWMYNSTEPEASLIYQMILLLGIDKDNVIFNDIRDSQTRLIQIPFMVYEKDQRWIDELETLLDCVRGQMYLNLDNKIVIEGGLYQSSATIDYTYDKSNLLEEVQQTYSYPDYNGAEQKYDRYDYGTNQVVYDVAQTLTVPANTITTDTIWRISYITDCVTQYGVTNAHGYTFNAAAEQVGVNLVEGVDYEFINFGNAGAQVKFYNNRVNTLYIDHFEIKGRPVYKYNDNEEIVRDNTITDDSQNNLVVLSDNKYIQTSELARDICEYEYNQQCIDTVNYSFKCLYSPFILPNHLIKIKIDDIDTTAKVTNIEHTLSRDGFFTKITAKKFVIIPQTFSYKSVTSISNTSTYLQKLNDLDNKIENIDIDVDFSEILSKMYAKGLISTEEPTATAEGDVWFNPDTKVFKVWKNGKWQTATDDDVMPALRTALMAKAGYFQLGQDEARAGLFFSYDHDSNNPVFGSTNTETLAQVSIDRQAGVLIENGNNRIAMNMKDAANPSKMKSQILLGVTNVNDSKHNNTIFQVGEETNGTYLKLEGSTFTQYVNGSELGGTLTSLNTTTSDNKNRLDNGNFTINANTTINGSLSVYSNDIGIYSYNGTNESNSTKRIVIKGGEILFQEKG